MGWVTAWGKDTSVTETEQREGGGLQDGDTSVTETEQREVGWVTGWGYISNRN